MIDIVATVECAGGVVFHPVFTVRYAGIESGRPQACLFFFHTRSGTVTPPCT